MVVMAAMGYMVAGKADDEAKMVGCDVAKNGVQYMVAGKVDVVV